MNNNIVSFPGENNRQASRNEMSNTLAFKAHVDRINTAWAKGVTSYIETAQHLVLAKEQLPDDAFKALIEEHALNFDASVSRKLLRIGRNQILCCAPGHKLPGWTIAWELAKADNHILKAALDDGRVHPRMTRKEAIALRQGDRVSSRLVTAPVETEAPSAFERLVAAWKETSEADHSRLFEQFGIQHAGQRKSERLKNEEIAREARCCSALLEHAEQNRDDIRKKLARIRSLAGAESNARRAGTKKSNAQLDRGAFARGMGMAGPSGEKFRTLTMTSTTDASGNIVHTLPRA